MLFLQILKGAFLAFEVVLLFNLLIVAHELGHLWAAVARGLKVDKFAVWFGKPIWARMVCGVECSLGWIPAGGFVSIPQMAPMDVLEGAPTTDTESLPPATPLDKAIVAFAGPLASFSLAVLLSFIVWFVGRPVGAGELTNIVGYVVEGGPAAAAGIVPGDQVVSVDGKPVNRFTPSGDARGSIVWNVAVSTKEKIPVVVNRNGTSIKLFVAPETPERGGWGRRALKQIGALPEETPVIAKVVRFSPAEHAGLITGDSVIAFNGNHIYSMESFGKSVGASGGKPITLLVNRGGNTHTVNLAAVIPVGETIPRLGIQWDLRGVTKIVHPTPWDQISGSVISIVNTVEAITTKGSGINATHLSGPVGVMRIYYVLFQSPDGWRLVLWFSVLLNVNLALMNLLPLPVLDGGHILMAGIESVIRRPIPMGTQRLLGNFCAALLIGFMLFVSFYDVLDLPSPFGREPLEKTISFGVEK